MTRLGEEMTRREITRLGEEMTRHGEDMTRKEMTEMGLWTCGETEFWQQGEVWLVRRFGDRRALRAATPEAAARAVRALTDAVVVLLDGVPVASLDDLLDALRDPPRRVWVV